MQDRIVRKPSWLRNDESFTSRIFVKFRQSSDFSELTQGILSGWGLPWGQLCSHRDTFVVVRIDAQQFC